MHSLVRRSFLLNSHLSRGVRSRSTPSTFAIAFDVDGVLWRGNEVISHTPRVLKTLSEKHVPFVLLTNGGGVLEAKKAAQFTEKFGVKIEDDQVCLSHTPMKELAGKYKNQLVLGLGKPDAAQILESYGFTNVVGIDDYLAQYPRLYPDMPITPKPHCNRIRGPVRAVMVLNDSVYWAREIQLICDLARSNGVPGNLAQDQMVPIYFSGTDFEYTSEFPVMRYGSGAFRVCVEHLYQQVTGKQLKYTLFGKPEVTSYRFAEHFLTTQAKKKGHTHGVHRYYMIGDNPLTDIQGALAAGEHWHPILVRTGNFKGDNDPTFPAKTVVDHVGDAIDFILERENAH
eukprot:GILI01012590.1.p1 GENE.GILI01012590.1~~GILI01012590.1.p1  ORF type:complete len:342 (-),score=63.40 GILI01012590.1:52-1077(-)